MIPPLFHRLCDDAALFPPGNASLADAVPQHLRYRDTEFADLVGPFVFPIPRLHELTHTGAPLALTLTAPGGPTTVAAGVDIARSIPGVSVVAVEVAVHSGIGIDALNTLDQDIDIYVEIPRDERRTAIFDAVNERGYRAKFRTGGITADLYPDEAELGAAIHEAVGRKIAFKATAGLHHAVRNTDPDNGFEQHGYLNVLLATQAAHSGATVHDIESILAMRDADTVAQLVSTITSERAFLSFGTCSIREPFDDLVTLGLIPYTGTRETV